MICVTIHNKTLEQIKTILESPEIEMAEIRLDSCELNDEEIRELFTQTDTPLVATAVVANIISRHPELKPCECAVLSEHRLSVAIESGARYADLDVLAPAKVSQRIQKLCSRNGVELIRSFHDYSGTPDSAYLRQIIQRCQRYGADVVKIVTAPQSQEDVSTLMALYDLPLSDGSVPEKGSLVAFAMGSLGKSSRLECLGKGAPFTYCALDENEIAAPGQWPLAEMRKAVYGIPEPYMRRGLRMPASKSFAQRAIIAAALAEGKSVLRHYTPCGDSEAALRVAEAFGAKVRRDGDTIEIEGIGPSLPVLESVNVGESGLLARLVIPLLAVGSGGEFRVSGEKTLLHRPLSGAADIMAAFGVVLSPLERQSDREVRIPLAVKGHLINGQADVSGLGGSQLISGLLMSLPLCTESTSMYVAEPRSIPYMYITLDVLRRFGIEVRSEMEGNAEMLELQDWSYCSGITFTTPGKCRYKAAEMDLEGDWSSAVPFLVAGAVFGSVEIEGLDSGSVQADINMIDILVEAGACVSSDEDGIIYVRKAPLEAFDTDLTHSPDLFAMVAVLASFCDGESHISGASRLAGKESNRAESILSSLIQLGVDASLDKDVLTVKGENLASRLVGGRLLNGGKYKSWSDHRIAMALKVASLGADSPLVIDDEACMAKSFPEFNTLF